MTLFKVAQTHYTNKHSYETYRRSGLKNPMLQSTMKLFTQIERRLSVTNLSSENNFVYTAETQASSSIPII